MFVFFTSWLIFDIVFTLIVEAVVLTGFIGAFASTAVGSVLWVHEKRLYFERLFLKVNFR